MTPGRGNDFVSDTARTNKRESSLLSLEDNPKDKKIQSRNQSENDPEELLSLL